MVLHADGRMVSRACKLTHAGPVANRLVPADVHVRSEGYRLCDAARS